MKWSGVKGEKKILFDCPLLEIIVVHREHSHLRNKMEASQHPFRQFYPPPLPDKTFERLSYPKWLAKRAINAQLPDRCSRSPRNYIAVPFKTRLFMHSHFGGRSRVYGFRHIGKSSNDKIVDRRPQRRVAKKLEWSEFSSVRNFSFSFSFFLGQHPPVDI